MSRLNELIRYFGFTDSGFTCFQKFFEDKVILADHDGSICDTNWVKDKLLGNFCREHFGEIDKDGNPILDERVNDIHRNAHGMPMETIFVEIAKTIYGKDIPSYIADSITKKLNEFILPSYLDSKIYAGAAEYHELLHLIGVPQYILTGMEEDVIATSLEKHGIRKYFVDLILGSTDTKSKWVSWITKKYPDKDIFATGDALSEYKATTAVKDTIFVGLDFEDRKERVFPLTVPVCKSYDELVRQIINMSCFTYRY